MKFITEALAKYLKKIDLHEELLDTKSKIKLKSKDDENIVENECVSSARSSDNEN